MHFTQREQGSYSRVCVEGVLALSTPERYSGGRMKPDRWIFVAQYDVMSDPEVLFHHTGTYKEALKTLESLEKHDNTMGVVRRIGVFLLVASSESGSYHRDINFSMYPDDLDTSRPWRD